MSSPRQSTSSGHSCDATVVDSNSAPSSPRKIMGHGEQRASFCDNPSRPHSVAAGSLCSSQANSDEEYVARKRHGWPQLAEKMAAVPEFAAFPRFRDLNVKNLLFYQVQLKALRLKIMKMEEEETVNVERYDHLVEDVDSQYHKLLLQLRDLLQGYNKALLQYSRVSAMSDPEAYNMASLRRWLMREDGADGFVNNKDGPDETWGDIKDTGAPDNLWKYLRETLGALVLSKPPPKANLDLVVTHPETKIDGLSKWIVYNLTPFYWTWQRKRQQVHREERRKRQEALEEAKERGYLQNFPPQTDEEAQKKGQRVEVDIDPEYRQTFKSMSELTAVRFTSALSTVIACLVPVIAIAVLTQISGTRNLLLCITGFAVVFAILLIFLTQGTTSRTEIFAATAAFSAVLVVFISQPDIQIQMPPGTNSPVINL